MTVKDIITGKKPSLSFEVFPPKTPDRFAAIEGAIKEIAALSPSYMSVTYGAGGGTSEFTAKIAAEIQERGVTALAHLSCISSTKAGVRSALKQLRKNGIENVLALRGDIPEGGIPEGSEYRYASELTAEIKSYGGFCIGGACYPEKHPESRNSWEDIENLKKKVDAGCEFLVTQMFFDNDMLYNFANRVARAGITVPVVPGIMPVTAASQLRRIETLSGSAIPPKMLRFIDRYGEKPLALRQAGIAFATEQIIDLFGSGFNAVHVYTMNKPETAREIRDNITGIIS